MKFILLLTFSFIFSVSSADREEQKKLSDYLKVLNECQDDSAIPFAVLVQLESFKGSDLQAVAAQGLYKEYLKRGSFLIAASRIEAYEVIKKSTDENEEIIKEKLALLRGFETLTEENIQQVNELNSELMKVFLPEEIKWSEDVNARKKLFNSLKSTLIQLDENFEPADFSVMDFIAKASVCPLVLKDKTILANYKTISSIPFQNTAAVYQINLVRAFSGKPALIIDQRLNLLALAHSKDMKDNNFFSHESPTEGMKTLQDRAARFKTSASEEIIGRGTGDILKLNRAYLKRLKNATLYYESWTRIGVGFYDKHWTEVFGK